MEKKAREGGKRESDPTNVIIPFSKDGTLTSTKSLLFSLIDISPDVGYTTNPINILKNSISENHSPK